MQYWRTAVCFSSRGWKISGHAVVRLLFWHPLWKSIPPSRWIWIRSCGATYSTRHPSHWRAYFAKLPFRFFFQARLVCKEWNRLASDEKFLEENVVPPAFLMRPHFCLMHPGGDWQIILTYNVAADEWHQMHMPLPYRKGYRANWVDGFLHISWPENESVKHVVLNLRTRMQYILPPQHIPEELTGYNCVEGLVVNKCQVVSGRGHPNRLEAWNTSIYGSESKDWRFIQHHRLKMYKWQSRINTSINTCNSICCKSILYTITMGWNIIVLCDLTLGTWRFLDVPGNSYGTCHLGLWQDNVYAVSEDCADADGLKRLRVHLLRQPAAEWVEVARIPQDLGRHIFSSTELPVWSIAGAEASFFEQYVLIAVSLRDQYFLRRQNLPTPAQGAWVPRRFCLYNLETGEWKYVNHLFDTGTGRSERTEEV